MNTPEFTLLYDGLCPICQKEVAWLSRWNKNRRLALQDINATDFQPEQFGKTHEELMAEIHGITANGQIIKGVPVFYAAYHAVGLGWLMAPTTWPISRGLFAWFYQLFAKHRLRLGAWFGGSRCAEGQCVIEAKKD